MMDRQTAVEPAAALPEFLAWRFQTFDHPRDVLACVDIPVAERRAILAGWASDARAVENAPYLRQLENGARVAVGEILEALRRLDVDRPAPAIAPAPSCAGVGRAGASRRRQADRPGTEERASAATEKKILPR